jgi:uncharacterized membrane protein
MNKLTLTSMIVSGFCLVVSEGGQAGDMEKCKIIGVDGKGCIKEHMCDCTVQASTAKEKYSCAGQNPPDDPDAWIFLPKGVCEKIVGGCLVN